MDKCFCHFNGYAVKDATARKQLEQLSMEIDVERERISSFVALPDGSTTADAEIIDARIGYDGKNYPTVGDAIRAQSGNNNEAISNMVIEGFERTALKENVKHLAEKTEGACCNQGNSTSSYKVRISEISTWSFYKLQVQSGEKYHIKTRASTGCIAYTLENLNGYSGVTGMPYEPTTKPTSGTTEYEYEITIPENAGYLYVNEQNSTPCEIKRIYPDVPAFKLITQPQITIDPLYGKKLACVGDSITEATKPGGGFFTNYAEIVASRHGMSVYKDGKGGSTMANVIGHNPFCVSRYLNVPADFDILTIWFGWNDNAYATLGTIEDTEDTTFYGAYKKVLDYFITTYPTKKIGLIVPYGGGTKIPTFQNAVRELSEMYGVPCLDLADGKQCSLLYGTANNAQLARRSALTYDGTHPNQDGHNYLSTMYEEFIKRL